MKQFILLTAFFLFNSSFSQETKFEKPNYKAIEKEITKKNSEYYYEDLLNKFNVGDSTLTLEQKRHFYYGFTFQSKYSTSYHSDAEKKLREVLNKEKLEENDYDKIINYGEEILKVNPFDLNVLDYLVYTYQIKKDLINYNKRLNQMRIIIDPILSSGDGVEKKSPIYVINVSHEYFILNVVGLNFGGTQSLVDGRFDYLKVAENENKIEGIYFDITPSLEKLNKMFKD
jgi:hypothetical protein